MFRAFLPLNDSWTSTQLTRNLMLKLFKSNYLFPITTVISSQFNQLRKCPWRNTETCCNHSENNVLLDGKILLRFHVIENKLIKLLCVVLYESDRSYCEHWHIYTHIVCEYNNIWIFSICNITSIWNWKYS